jgi:hypothetical protein
MLRPIYSLVPHIISNPTPEAPLLLLMSRYRESASGQNRKRAISSLSFRSAPIAAVCGTAIELMSSIHISLVVRSDWRS